MAQVAAPSPRRAAPAPPRQHAAGPHTQRRAAGGRARSLNWDAGAPRNSRSGRRNSRNGRRNISPPKGRALICLRRRSDRKDDPTKERGDAPRALRDGGRTGRKPCSELQADDVAHSGADGEADARAVLQADDAAYSLAHGEAYADADVQAHG